MSCTLKRVAVVGFALAAVLFGSAAQANAQCCCRPAGTASQNPLLIQQQQYALQQYAAQQRAATLAAQQRLQNAYNAIDRQQRLLYQQQNPQLRNSPSQPNR